MTPKIKALSGLYLAFAIAWLGGCTTLEPEFRSKVSAPSRKVFFEGPVSDVDVVPIESDLNRKVVDENYDVVITPITRPIVELRARAEGTREGLGEDAIRRGLREDLDRFVETRSCFRVSLAARNENAVLFKHWHLTIVDANRKTYKLEYPARLLKLGEESLYAQSYDSDYRPTPLAFLFGQAAVACAAERLELADGFTVKLEHRAKEFTWRSALVWKTDGAPIAE